MLSQTESRERRRNSGENPAAATLMGALVKYVGPAHDKADVRRAINVWRHDAANAGLQPEKLLIQFKDVLRGVMPARGSRALDRWENDRREMIVMCIEEFFAGARDES